jgi:DNA (cytosine-5)-methyltransferase 1
MKYFSTFSGIGGFELGIRNAALSVRDGATQITRTTTFEQGVEPAPKGLQPDRNSANTEFGRDTREVSCVGYSEIDKYAIKVYERNFYGHTNYGDITKINADELPDFDCLVGGFPCQAFSIAGKRRGFDDVRGTLFFDLARILRAKQPRLFVFENVKGLLNHANGETFRVIIQTIDELGYDCQWQVLNSKNFGVPQNRERVVIVGHLRGTPRPEVFPFTAVYGNNLKEITSNVSDAQRIYTTDLAKSQKALGGGLGAKTGLYAIPVITPDRLEKRQNGRRMKTDGEPAFTVTAQDRHGIYDGMKIRRLTPLECERLQGFPDDWTEFGEDEHGVRVDISDAQRYKMCGNAVTTNVIQAVFERLLK